MYRAHFQLNQKPFQITTDPLFLWPGEKYREALAVLRYGIMDNKGFLLLTGDVGTGKTTLINALVESLGDDTLVAVVPDPGLNSLDFYHFISSAFGLPTQFDRKAEFLIQFKKFLLKAHAQRKRVLLVIDEAQRASQNLLEEIRMLSNLERHDAKLINIFFVGQNELNQMLRTTQNRALRQRIALNYNIDHLKDAEVKAYIDHRLQVAGARKQIFEPGVISLISRFSGGYPRRINVLCDHCLVTAYVRGVELVDGKIVRECARELAIPDMDPGRHGAPPTAPGPSRQPQPAAEPRSAAVQPSADSGAEPEPEPVPKPAAPLKTKAPHPEVPPQPRRSHWGIIITGGVLAAFIGILVLLWQYPDFIAKRLKFDTGSRDSLESTAGDTVSQPAGPEITPPEAKPVPVATPPSPPEAKPVPGATPSPTPEAKPVPALAAPASPEPPPAAAPEVSSARGEDEPLLDLGKITIPFGHNSNALAAESFALLDRLAAALHQRPAAKVQIRGYSDSSGVYSYNLKLSEFRAQMVKSYLVGKGVPPQQLTVKGMGPQNPVKTGDDYQDRIESRRVEIEIER